MLKYLSILLLLSVMMSGCVDRNLKNEPVVIRDYTTDALIMSRFVDVDHDGMLYLNGNKKITASDYILSKSREEYDCVSDLNRRLFMEQLDNINQLILSTKFDKSTDAIIYNLYSDCQSMNLQQKMLVSKDYNFNKKTTHIIRSEITAPNSSQPDKVRFKCNQISKLKINPSGADGSLYAGQITLKDCTDNQPITLMIVGINDGTDSLPIAIDLNNRTKRTWELSGLLYSGSDAKHNSIAIDILE